MISENIINNKSSKIRMESNEELLYKDINKFNPEVFKLIDLEDEIPTDAFIFKNEIFISFKSGIINKYDYLDQNFKFIEKWHDCSYEPTKIYVGQDVLGILNTENNLEIIINNESKIINLGENWVNFVIINDSKLVMVISYDNNKKLSYYGLNGNLNFSLNLDFNIILINIDPLNNMVYWFGDQNNIEYYNYDDNKLLKAELDISKANINDSTIFLKSQNYLYNIVLESKKSKIRKFKYYKNYLQNYLFNVNNNIFFFKYNYICMINNEISIDTNLYENIQEIDKDYFKLSKKFLNINLNKEKLNFSKKYNYGTLIANFNNFYYYINGTNNKNIIQVNKGNFIKNNEFSLKNLKLINNNLIVKSEKDNFVYYNLLDGFEEKNLDFSLGCCYIKDFDIVLFKSNLNFFKINSKKYSIDKLVKFSKPYVIFLDKNNHTIMFKNDIKNKLIFYKKFEENTDWSSNYVYYNKKKVIYYNLGFINIELTNFITQRVSEDIIILEYENMYKFYDKNFEIIYRIQKNTFKEMLSTKNNFIIKCINNSNILFEKTLDSFNFYNAIFNNSNKFTHIKIDNKYFIVNLNAGIILKKYDDLDYWNIYNNYIFTIKDLNLEIYDISTDKLVFNKNYENNFSLKSINNFENYFGIQLKNKEYDFFNLNNFENIGIYKELHKILEYTIFISKNELKILKNDKVEKVIDLNDLEFISLSNNNLYLKNKLDKITNIFMISLLDYNILKLELNSEYRSIHSIWDYTLALNSNNNLEIYKGIILESTIKNYTYKIDTVFVGNDNIILKVGELKKIYSNDFHVLNFKYEIILKKNMDIFGYICCLINGSELLYIKNKKDIKTKKNEKINQDAIDILAKYLKIESKIIEIFSFERIILIQTEDKKVYKYMDMILLATYNLKEFKFSNNFYLFIYDNKIELFSKKFELITIFSGIYKNNDFIKNDYLYLYLKDRSIIYNLNINDIILDINKEISNFNTENKEIFYFKDNNNSTNLYIYNKLILKIDKPVISVKVFYKYIVLKYQNNYEFYDYYTLKKVYDFENLNSYDVKNSFIYFSFNQSTKYHTLDNDELVIDSKNGRIDDNYLIFNDDNFIMYELDKLIFKLDKKYSKYIIKYGFIILSNNSDHEVYSIAESKLILTFNSSSYKIDNYSGKKLLILKLIEDKNDVYYIINDKDFVKITENTKNFRIEIENGLIILKDNKNFTLYNYYNLKSSIKISLDLKWIEKITSKLFKNIKNKQNMINILEKIKELNISNLKLNIKSNRIILTNNKDIYIYNLDCELIVEFLNSSHYNEYGLYINNNMAYIFDYKILLNSDDNSIEDNKLVKMVNNYIYYQYKEILVIIDKSDNFKVFKIINSYKNVTDIKINNSNIIIFENNTTYIYEIGYNYAKFNLDFEILLFLNEFNYLFINRVNVSKIFYYNFFTTLKEKSSKFKEIFLFFIFVVLNVPKKIIRYQDETLFEQEIFDLFFEFFNLENNTYIEFESENPMDISTTAKDSSFFTYFIKKYNNLNIDFNIEYEQYLKILRSNYQNIVKFNPIDELFFKDSDHNFAAKKNYLKNDNDIVILDHDENLFDEKLLKKFENNNDSENYFTVKNFNIKMPLNLVDAIEFLELYSEFSDDIKILNIKHLIIYYWRNIGIIKYFNSVCYFIMILCLILKMIYFPNNIILFIIILIINILLSLYEIIQLKHHFKMYFSSVLNIYEILLILLNIASVIFIQFIPHDLNNIFNFIVIYWNSFKFLTIFKLFDNFRTQIRLFIKVITQTSDFIIFIFLILGYLTFINIILYFTENQDKNYIYGFSNVYDMMWGNWNDDFRGSFTYKHFIEFFINTLIFAVILLNLFISVVSDIFEDYNSNKELYDLEEISSLLFEYLSIYQFFYKNKKSSFDYIFVFEKLKIEENKEQKNFDILNKQSDELKDNLKKLDKKVLDILKFIDEKKLAGKFKK